VAKRKNKPIFIDFTGLACVNCRKMEANVWPDPRVLKMLKNDYILVQLYVDDKTALAPDEVYVSETRNKKIKTVGDKFADLQAIRYKANSQPFYVPADHDGNPLATPRGYDGNVDAFVAFLEEGIKNFKSKSK
jgi:thioredoxin-related protein